jgi:hypothetical protein
MVLFKLEIPIPDPNMGGFGGKLTPWKFLEALGPQNGTCLRETASFDVWILTVCDFVGYALLCLVSTLSTMCMIWLQLSAV